MGRCTIRICILWLGIFIASCGVLAFDDGDVRLSDGGATYGRVEVYYSGDWGVICSDHFNHNAALVICRQLGYDALSTQVSVSSQTADPGLTVSLHYVTCVGSEDTVGQCDIPYWGVSDGETCTENSDAWVDCDHTTTTSTSTTPSPPTLGSIRLTQSSKGRLEIYLNGTWGTVCDRFRLPEGKVVCRQLDLPSDDISIREGARFGQGTGQIWQVECDGTESQVIACSPTPAPPTCNHGKDVGVICGYSDDDLPSVKHDSENMGWKHYYIVAPVGILVLIGWAIYSRCNKKARMKRQQRVHHGTTQPQRRGFGTVSLGVFSSNNTRLHQAPKHSRNTHAISHGVQNRHFIPVESDVISSRESEYSAHELRPGYPIHHNTVGNHASTQSSSRPSTQQLFTTQTSGRQALVNNLEVQPEFNASGQIDSIGREQGPPDQPGLLQYARSGPKPPAYETEFDIPMPPAYDEIYPTPISAETKM